MQRAVSSILRNTLRHLSSSTTLCGSRSTPKNGFSYGKKHRNRPSHDSEENDLRRDSRSLKQESLAAREPPSDLPPSMRKKYRIFTDESEEVVDSLHSQWVDIEAAEEPETDEFQGLNMERGVTGVLDIEDLIHVLQLENARDICTIKIPPEIQYADYIVICTGSSSRQLTAMAEFVRRYYKKKRLPEDPPLTNSLGIKDWKSDWVALDLGNIVVHFMDETIREFYDIESLWALGPEHDAKSSPEVDAALTLFRQHTRSAAAANPDKFGTIPKAATLMEKFGL